MVAREKSPALLINRGDRERVQHPLPRRGPRSPAKLILEAASPPLQLPEPETPPMPAVATLFHPPQVEEALLEPIRRVAPLLLAEGSLPRPPEPREGPHHPALTVHDHVETVAGSGVGAEPRPLVDAS